MEDVLELKFEKVAEDSRVVERGVPTFRAKVSGPGNEMKLGPVEGGESVVWKREGL